MRPIFLRRSRHAAKPYPAFIVEAGSMPRPCDSAHSTFFSGRAANDSYIAPPQFWLSTIVRLSAVSYAKWIKAPSAQGWAVSVGCYLRLASLVRGLFIHSTPS